MPRTRAWRRHERRVKLNRRYRIVATVFRGTLHDPRERHVHLRCNCFDDPRDHGRGRRSIETREWHALERRAWG
jgi:hypothetical protein